MDWSLYLVADKALNLRVVRLLAYSHTHARQTMQRLYQIHPERISILCHIPLVD